MKAKAADTEMRMSSKEFDRIMGQALKVKPKDGKQKRAAKPKSGKKKRSR